MIDHIHLLVRFRWTAHFGNISLSPTSNQWLSFSEGGSPSCMMVGIFVIFWTFVTIFSSLHFNHLCRTSKWGGSSSVADAVQRTKRATPHRQHLRTSHPGLEISHVCLWIGLNPRKCWLTTCYLRHPLAPPLGIGLYSSTPMSARHAGAGHILEKSSLGSYSRMSVV